MTREATVERNTKETKIAIKLNLDGTGKSSLDTGVGFFNHMLDGFTRHGLFDLDIKVKGDLQVIIPLKIRELFLAQLLKKRLETRKESGVTEAASFQWMSVLCFAPLISGDARIFPSKVRLPVKKLEICPQKW